MARFQRETEEALTIESRGDIVSRNNWILATTETKNSFYIDPQTISTENFKKLSDELAGIIPDIDKFKERFELDKVIGKRFTWLERRVSNEQAGKINSLNSPWIKSQKEYVRVYPNEYLASSVLGYTTAEQTEEKEIVGEKEEEKGLVGEKGVEKSFDEYLRFRKLRTTYNIDEQNRNSTTDNASESKKTVVLTLDEAMQNTVEILLEESIKKTNAMKGTVIVLSPHSGEILAMATYPSFDPNKFKEVSSDFIKNQAVERIYEPGEAFTPFAKTALLEMTGDKSVLENTGNCEAIDKRKYFEQLDSLGFRKTTGIELQEAKEGILDEKYTAWHNRKICKILEKGQEIAVTPLHMAAYTGMLANGGIWVTPFILLRVNDANGAVVFETKPFGKRMIKKANNAEILKFLTEKNSTDKKLLINNFIGIEGSSYKLNNDKQYEFSRQIVTVTGFFPVADPQFVVTLVIDEPEKIDSARQIILKDYNKIIQAVSGKYSLQ